MSTMRKSNPVIAILCADIHLSATPPLARAQEPNWFEAMARPLQEIEALALQHQVGILCAGDVFDRWNPSPELINFALDFLPKMHAIPGQHDLPLHAYEDIHKSAYWTMVKVGKIVNLKATSESEDLSVTGFPWGSKVIQPTPTKALRVCLHHAYRWTHGTGYSGAKSEGYLNHDEYKGYNVVVIGDNHISWESYKDNQTVFNCGSLMRRKSDQASHKPRVGLLHQNGRVESHYLDISKDILTEGVKDTIDPVVESAMKNYIKHLQDVQGITLDYRETLTRALDSQDEAVKKLLFEAIEHGNNH